MAEQKTYTIPLRKSFTEAAPKKRTPRAVRAVKAYIIKHAKVEDVKLGAQLNDALWARGITNPPHKLTVTAVIDNGVAKVELEGHKYVEAVKPEVKKDESAMEKLVSKVGGGAKKDTLAEPAEEEKPASEKATPAASTEAKPAAAKKKAAAPATEKKKE